MAYTKQDVRYLPDLPQDLVVIEWDTISGVVDVLAKTMSSTRVPEWIWSSLKQELKNNGIST